MTKEFIIGSYPKAKDKVTIKVEDAFKEVSNNHCKISYQKDNFYIEDLNSENGTYVDGKLINEITPINENSKITLGKNTEFSINHKTVQFFLDKNQDVKEKKKAKSKKIWIFIIATLAIVVYKIIKRIL